LALVWQIRKSGRT